MKVIGFKYAYNGIRYCCRNEINFAIHILATVFVAGAGYYFSISRTEWLFVIGWCVLVLVTEMINTALENLCDLVTMDCHPLVKSVKDIAAGAVLLSATGSIVTAGFIFLPKIFS